MSDERVGEGIANHLTLADLRLSSAALSDAVLSYERENAELKRQITAYQERMDRDSDGYLKSLGEIAEIQAETNQLSRDLENENAELKTIVDAVDEILLVNWIAAEGGYGKGDYRKALHDLVSHGVAEYNDPLISEPAKARHNLLAAAKATLADCRKTGRCADAALMPGECCSNECAALAEAVEAVEASCSKG